MLFPLDWMISLPKPFRIGKIKESVLTQADGFEQGFSQQGRQTSQSSC
jgi:hypothetical protein